MENKIYKNGKKFRNLDELWLEINNAFYEIDKGYIEKLYQSIKGRMIEVARLGGDLSKY